MNPIARVEDACARFVENAFARVFPGELDPAQVGRKLVAVMQASAGDLYLVRVHPADHTRFEADRAFIEARWNALLGEAMPAGRCAGKPRALLHEDSRIVAGSVVIEAVSDARQAAIVLERLDGGRTVVRAGLRLGRAFDNDIVIRDHRASRYHARIVAAPAGFAIEDIGSSNGTFVDGRPATHQPLAVGSTVTLGSTHLRVTSVAD